MKTASPSRLCLAAAAFLLLGGLLASCSRPVRITDYIDPLVLVSGLQPVLCDEAGRNDYAIGEILLTEDRSTDSRETYFQQCLCTAGPGRRLVLEMEYTIAPERIRIDYTLTPEGDPGQPSEWGLAYKPRGLKGLRYVGRGRWRNARTYEGGLRAVRRALLDLWQGTLQVEGARYLEADPANPDEVLFLERGPAPFRSSLTFTLH